MLAAFCNNNATIVEMLLQAGADVCLVCLYMSMRVLMHVYIFKLCVWFHSM